MLVFKTLCCVAAVQGRPDRVQVAQAVTFPAGNPSFSCLLADAELCFMWCRGECYLSDCLTVGHAQHGRECVAAR
jgi:hypothetical protein